MNDNYPVPWRLLTVVLLLLLCQGCAVVTESTVITPPIRSLFAGTYAADPFMAKNMPKTVAVLPFVNEAESQRGSEEVRRGFYNHFSSLPFADMQIQRVDSLLRKADLMGDPKELAKKTPQELGKILGVDAVVYGTVSNFDKLFLALYSQVSVGADVKMYDTKTGHFLWSGKHTARIHEGGISTNPVGIVAVVIATSLNMRDIQLLRACDDLFRDMVQTIPVPSLAEALRPPSITLLTQDTKNLPKKAGDEIKVVLQGTPKMMASFSIGDYRKHIDMQETEPGWYLGTYRVVPGDNVRQAIITGRLALANDPGNFSEWVDAVGTVSLKTTPPDAPANVATVGRDRIVQLRWNKSSDPDLAGYRVYRSATPLSGYVEVAKTEFTEFTDRDPSLRNGTAYYYQITAVDLAGNESTRKGAVAGMPVAPGPTPVSGIIEADTTWHAGASPYVLEGPVTVRDQAVLTIQPGTEIRSKDATLTVEGRLMARGDSEHIIVFDTAQEGKMWPGIRFRNVKDKVNALSYVRIRNARRAVDCEASSPVVESSELTENDTAFRASGAFSIPRLLKSRVARNRQSAVVAVDGAGPLVADNAIEDNLNAGILVERASPVVQRNSISRNLGSGIVVAGGNPSITENNVSDNRPFNALAPASGDPVMARGNWWGSAKGLDVLAGVQGKVDVQSILGSPWPGGKSLDLPVLSSRIGGRITSDAYLIQSNSPYTVTSDVILDGGAVLTIERGVTVRFDQNTALVAENGGVIARGTRDLPILFTASGASPSPGFYASAFRMTKPTAVNSAFSWCIVKYAETAFDIHFGSPEISHCHVAENSQCGIYCRNDASPRIFYNTFTGNRGEGAVKCVGTSRPLIQRNNFERNEVAIQSFSSLYIDARQNWWGKSPPDMRMIFGDPEKNVNIRPWLERPEPDAFREPK
ncbi:MAG: hypothetical protein CVU61_02540 [Deltaproteobacteria bacterium HGW-Deltaproteobacteria-19]|jgi:hypothetical protein|nr:MAG: hypothetical protein CVU61_02540 [Deltaproteobacteria bacterium HGW-Deltaproteobacteria-19]